MYAKIMVVGKLFCWLPIERLSKYKVFSVFFAKEFKNLSSEIKHIVTKEQGGIRWVALEKVSLKLEIEFLHRL